MRELRNANELTRNALAKKLGVSMQSIYDWEIGKHETDFVTLIKIADYFDVSIDELLGRKEL